MSYHLQRNGKAERYNNKIIARLQHYVTHHQRDWNVYGQRLTYAYNGQMNIPTNLSPLSLALPHNNHGPPYFDNPMALSTDATAKTSPDIIKAKLLHCIATNCRYAERKMKSQEPGFEEDHGREICNAPLLFNAEWYIYLDQPPMNTSAADSLETES